MVSWARAFKAAAIFVGYSKLWDIIGALLIVLGYGMSGLLTFTHPDPYQFADGIIVLIVGFVILALGNVATFFKVNTDIIADEIGERFQTHEEEDAEKPTITA